MRRRLQQDRKPNNARMEDGGRRIEREEREGGLVGGARVAVHAAVRLHPPPAGGAAAGNHCLQQGRVPER